MRRFVRGVVRPVFTGVVALILLFEEWGWEPLAAALERLGRLTFLSWLERSIRALPPWAALATFAVPALALLPIKLLALFLIGHGQAFAGVAVLVAAKVGGTALLARLFTLTQPTLMRLRWFAHWYPRWKSWKDRVMAQVRASPVWRAGSRLRQRMRAAWARWRQPGA